MVLGWVDSGVVGCQGVLVPREGSCGKQHGVALRTELSMAVAPLIS